MLHYLLFLLVYALVTLLGVVGACLVLYYGFEVERLSSGGSVLLGFGTAFFSGPITAGILYLFGWKEKS